MREKRPRFVRYSTAQQVHESTHVPTVARRACVDGVAADDWFLPSRARDRRRAPVLRVRRASVGRQDPRQGDDLRSGRCGRDSLVDRSAMGPVQSARTAPGASTHPELFKLLQDVARTCARIARNCETVTVCISGRPIPMTRRLPSPIIPPRCDQGRCARRTRRLRRVDPRMRARRHAGHAEQG